MAKRWTDETVDELRRLYELRVSDFKIGQIMGRTTTSIEIKRVKIGLVGAPVRPIEGRTTNRVYGCGPDSTSWKGGRRISSAGYVEIRAEYHHRLRGNGYVYEHILVVEENIGRQLKQEEIVHHIDGNKTNNSFENLAVMSQAEHASLHHSTGRTMTELKCPICGNVFITVLAQSKGRITCSRKCGGIRQSQVRTLHPTNLSLPIT